MHNANPEIEAITMEDNVVQWALKNAKVTTDVTFEELMNLRRKNIECFKKRRWVVVFIAS